MSFLSGFEKFVRQAEPLAMHTWFQLGGPAEYFAEPLGVDDLVAILRRARQEDLPVHVLGRGSNILVRDEGVRGVVMTLSAPAFRQIEIAGDAITAGGGARLGRVVTTAAYAGLAGLEELVAIPGTVGGALHGNAGAPGAEIGQWTARATVITDAGEVVQRHREDMVFGYRESNLDEPVILGARLELEQDDPKHVARRLQKHWIIRKARQPMGHQCAGCIFKNPPGMHAGELIDKSGLKNTRIGGAVVSDRHANFIVAEPECTSQDVLRLIELVRDQVAQRMEVELEQELEVW
ncbi:MAG: UDP-N-acetylmuramate dehydrogenase [Planctomycetia bacterium]|nr:UDP-N-acetylmuramate dehydrogenase [Planctomycetia bacterium]